MLVTSSNITYDATDDFFKSITELTGLQVMVGIPSSEQPRRGDNITNAALGYIHEHGSPIKHIPARPFLEPTIERLQDKAVAMLQRAATFRMEHHPEDALNTLQALGLLGAAEVKKTIVAGIPPPLRPATLQARANRHGLSGNVSSAQSRAGAGAYKPLIDTGQLLASITYVIRKK